MKTFKFVIIVLALAVGMAGFNVDAKKRKKVARRVSSKVKVTEPAAKNYQYVETVNDDQVFETAAYAPEYPGGTEGLIKFLADNIQYPKNAEKKNAHGTVILQFIVEKTGAISDVQVLKSVNKELDAEAVRVVKQITRFVPGYDKNHAPVRVRYTLPVKFELQ